MSTGGTTVSMAYDAWGRMTSKTDGTYSAAYAYRYGDKLYSVTSDFPSEGTVTYEYGGDRKRRERSVSGGDYTWYNWDMGFNVINEENSNGTLSMTYVMDSPAAQVAGILADASTTNPATGTYRHYNHDNLGSTRRLRASDKSSLAAYEYTPYGQAYVTSGVALGSLADAFTGKAWDDTSQLYYFPYRYYSPQSARWLTRDPLGMVDGPNPYAYVASNPVLLTDPEGSIIVIDPCAPKCDYCMEVRTKPGRMRCEPEKGQHYADAKSVCKKLAKKLTGTKSFTSTCKKGWAKVPVGPPLTTGGQKINGRQSDYVLDESGRFRIRVDCKCKGRKRKTTTQYYKYVS